MNIFSSMPAKKIVLAGLLFGGFGVALILFLFDPLQSSIYPVCPLHHFTGLNCPGCGSLRALHQLLHGNFAEAMHLNPFLVFSLPFFGWASARLAWRKIKNQPVSPEISSFWVWIFLACMVVFGILRNLPVTPFNSFAIWRMTKSACAAGRNC